MKISTFVDSKELSHVILLIEKIKLVGIFLSDQTHTYIYTGTCIQIYTYTITMRACVV